MRRGQGWWLVLGLVLVIGLAIGIAGCGLVSGAKDKPDAVGVVGPSGGSVRVEDERSPIYGVRVEIPPGAVDGSTRIAISASAEALAGPIGFDHALSSAFEIIVVSGAGPTSARIFVPFDKLAASRTEDLVLVHRSRAGSECHFTERVDWEAGVAEFVVSHFSTMQLYAGTKVFPSTFSTPFDPYWDSFPVVNSGAKYPEFGNGVCAGMAYFTTWYFDKVRRSARGPRLREAYGVPEAVRIAVECQPWVALHLATGSDQENVYKIVTGMQATNLPVVVGLDNGPLSTAHAVVAYRWSAEEQAVYCWDPDAQVCTDLADLSALTGKILYVGNDDWQYIGPKGVGGDQERYSRIYYQVDHNYYEPYYIGLMPPRWPLRDAWENAAWTVELGLESVRNLSRPSAAVSPGDLIQITLSLRVNAKPIRTATTLNIAHEADLARPVFDSHKSNISGLWEGERDKYDRQASGTRSEQVTFEVRVPQGARPGKYYVLGATRYYLYALHDACCPPVVYDVTGNGPNSSWTDGMWLLAFEVVRSQEEKYSVSGRVSTSTGAGLAGVMISFTQVSGPSSVLSPATTDNNGYWSKSGVPTGSTYRAMPSLSGYTFSPPYWEFSNSSSSLNFTAVEDSPIRLDLWVDRVEGSTVTVNGYVATTDGTIQRMRWEWGDGTSNDSWFPASHTYASAGQYAITVTAFSSTGKTRGRTITVAVGSPRVFRVSGRVTTSAGGLTGVTVTFTRIGGSGIIPGSVQTDGSGNWTQGGFEPGTTYRAIPSLVGYTFSPPYRDFSLPSDSLNFYGTAADGGEGVIALPFFDGFDNTINTMVWEYVDPPQHRASVSAGRLLISAGDDWTQSCGIVTKGIVPNNTKVEFDVMISYLNCANMGQPVFQARQGPLNSQYRYPSGPDGISLWAMCDGFFYVRTSAGANEPIGRWSKTEMKRIVFVFGSSNTQVTYDGVTKTIPFVLSSYHVHFGGHIHEAYFDNLRIAMRGG